MKLTFSQHEAARVLAVEGRFLGSIERAAWQNLLDALRNEQQTRLVLDLSKTDFIDSTGAGLVVRAAQRLRAAGGDLRLAGMRTPVKNVFVMTRLLGRAVEAHPTVAEALQSFAERPAAPAASVPK